MEKKRILSDTVLEILTIVFVVSGIMLIVYQQKGIYPFGSGTIAYGDMMQHTIPENLYYMWDVLHGKANAFFSWNSGLGINISGVASEQAYLSPLNLFIIFSSRENLMNFVNILMIIKMVCIGIAMYFYMNKYKVAGLSKVCAGIIYAFGASSLIHYNIMFVMDMAFLLPILMIGYDRVLKMKKCALFIATCSFCLIENVYMSFMVLLFVLITSGVQLLCSAKEIENKGEHAFLLGISVTISVMVSAALMLPSVIAILKSSRLRSTLFETYFKAVNSTWLQMDWDMAKYMLISLTFPLVVCIYNLVVRKKNWKRYRENLVLSILLLIPIIMSGTELLWHGGSRIWWPVRFAFVISFVVLDFMMRLFQDMDFKSDETKKRWGYWFFLTVIGILCSRGIYGVVSVTLEISAYKELIYWLVACFCGAGYLCVLYRKKAGWSILILLFEITFIAHLFVAPDMYITNEYSVDILKDAQSMRQGFAGYLEPFERVKNSDGSIANVNYSLVMGSESLGNFLHVINESYLLVVQKWGYSTYPTRLLDTGGTILTDTLLGIKYLISNTELSDILYDKISGCDGSSGNHYYVYGNKYAIPLISYLKTELTELSDNDIFANQNTIFKAVTGLEEDLIVEYDGIKSDGSTVIDVGDRQVLYMYGENNQDISIKVNGEDIIIPSKDDAENLKYPVDFNNNLLCLGYYEEQTLTIDFSGVQEIEGIHLGLLDVDIFERGINQINNEIQENIISRDNTSVRIELDSDRDCYIFVPILYDEGWICEVNDNKQSVQEVFGFIKVHVQQGPNSIYLKYVPQGRNTGIIITSAGILVYALFLLIYVKREHGRYFNYIYKTSYFALVGMFVGVMILFYIIPTIRYLERLLIGI